MKEAQDTRKKSILSKIIDALKNSILSDILFSEEAGQVISPEELDSEARVNQLAHETGTDETTMWSYERNFNEAAANLEKLEKAVSKIPTPKKESPNPFKVDESELSQETSSLVQNTSERTRDSGGKSLDD
ncbi:MAG: hypothetical protein ACI4VN_03925 [Clostridia bacterium]|nr:hypothetical protein [Clostridia bacterium]